MVEPRHADLRFESFPERPLAEAEAILVRLFERGAIRGDQASDTDLRSARLPSTAGPAFLALARRYRAIVLPEAEIRIELHDGAAVDDSLGGWRLFADPSMLDLRLDVPADPASECDTFHDATTWRDSTFDAVRHSSIVHFLVRAAAGDAHDI